MTPRVQKLRQCLEPGGSLSFARHAWADLQIGLVWCWSASGLAEQLEDFSRHVERRQQMEKVGAVEAADVARVF